MSDDRIGPKKIKVLAPLLPVVGDAGIAHPGLAHGKIVPLVIVDDSACPQLSELIRVHEHVIEGGDLTTQWGTQKNVLGKIKVVLLLDFIRPVEMSCVFGFDLRKHGLVIDQIIRASKAHVMTGKPGDRYIANMNRPKIHLDVPETGFGPVWSEIYTRQTFDEFRRRGLSKKDASRATEEFFKQRDQMAAFSVNARPQP